MRNHSLRSPSLKLLASLPRVLGYRSPSPHSPGAPDKSLIHLLRSTDTYPTQQHTHTVHEPHEGALGDASPHAPLCSAVLLLCCA